MAGKRIDKRMVCGVDEWLRMASVVIDWIAFRTPSSALEVTPTKGWCGSRSTPSPEWFSVPDRPSPTSISGGSSVRAFGSAG